MSTEAVEDLINKSTQQYDYCCTEKTEDKSGNSLSTNVKVDLSLLADKLNFSVWSNYK